MRRIVTAMGVAALAAGAALAQEGAEERAHLCAAYVDAESGQTRIIDVDIRSEEPFQGVIDLGDGAPPTGFIGRRAGERCSILTSAGLALQGTCVAGGFAGRFTVSEGGDDDDDDGPPPVPVTFAPAACP